MKIVFTYIL